MALAASDVYDNVGGMDMVFGPIGIEGGVCTMETREMDHLCTS